MVLSQLLVYYLFSSLSIRLLLPDAREVWGTTREVIVDDLSCCVGSMQGSGQGSRESLINPLGAATMIA